MIEYVDGVYCIAGHCGRVICELSALTGGKYGYVVVVTGVEDEESQ